MSVATAVNLEERLDHLHQFIREGLILEAMQKFYGEHVSMRENNQAPTVGLAANLQREKQFLDGVKEWKGFQVRSKAVGNDVTFYEAVFDFLATNGQPVHLEQVDVAKWRDGKIVEQRFYYDTAPVKNS